MKKSIYTILSLLLHSMVGYTQNLNFEWERSITCIDNNSNYSNCITVDKNNDLLFAGWLGGKSNFDPSGDSLIITPFGDGAAFVAKYNKTGLLIWEFLIGGDSTCFIEKIICDNENNIIIRGSFTGYIDCDPGPNEQIIKSGIGEGIFILKLNSNGNFLWIKKLETFYKPPFSGNTYGQNKITIDSFNNIYCYVNFGSKIILESNLDTIELISQPNNKLNSLIIKFDSEGELNWQKAINQNSSQGYCIVTSITSSPSGNLAIAGSFSGKVNFDQGSNFELVIPDSTQQIFILNVDELGISKWIKTLENIIYQKYSFAYAIKFDNSQNIVLGGRFQGSIDFDPGLSTEILTNLSTNLPDFFTLKFDKNGEFQWARQFGGPYWDIILDLAIDKNNNIYSTGRMVGDHGFPLLNDTINFKLLQGGFIYKLNELGVGLDIVVINATGFPGDGRSLGIDTENNIYYCGQGKLNLIVTKLNDTILLNTPSNSISLLKFNQCIKSNSELNISSCNDYTLNGISYNKSGNYTQTLKTNNNCDSIVNLNLTIEPLDTSVIQIGNTLKAGLDGASYQWIDCETQLPIPTMTNQIFTPTTKGSYAVIINNGQCSDTSNCIQLTNVATHESQDSTIRIYPNPTKGIIQVQIPEFTEAEILIIDMLGKSVLKYSINDQTKTIDLSGLTSGLYTVIVQNDKLYCKRKVLKE